MIERTTETTPTTAAERLDWLAAASARVPVPEGELRELVAPALLDASGGPDGFNATAAAMGPIVVTRLVAARHDRAQAIVRSGSGSGDLLLTVRIDPASRVDHVAMTAEQTPPASWAELDDRLAALPGRVSFAAAEITPQGCHVVHGLRQDALRPTGSVFKLYVLGALGQAVAEDRASWDELLAVRDEAKSLPSGILQDRPAGDRLTPAEFAVAMMSVSDNTATDHLIHRLGREAVARQFELFGHQRPAANAPLLTTRAFFQLKYVRAHAHRYLSAPAHERAAVVEGLERLPLPDTSPPWTEPRDIDRIEWFASPVDVCRAYAGLLRLDQPEIDRALSLADGGLNLDLSRFPTVWSKSGSEPGVVTLSHLVRTPDGRALAVGLLVSDPDTAPDPAAVLTTGQAVVRGAFHLLAAPR
ncbi:serine hydrolase [Kitasatospora sp. NPDC089797]|uniref:serine hydrolase n=1 Tax=Kitasatospora sp. NPDC089797 TaxID=3155298 RepID=UPI00342AA9B2